MQVKMILPALTEAISPYFRPIKYSLFPPLGLATLAGYLHEDDQVTIQDEHVEKLDLNDDPELVVIQVYITSAYRAWDLYDTRHVVYHPAKLRPETLEAGRASSMLPVLETILTAFGSHTSHTML